MSELSLFARVVSFYYHHPKGRLGKGIPLLPLSLLPPSFLRLLPLSFLPVKPLPLPYSSIYSEGHHSSPSQANKHKRKKETRL